MGEWAPMPSRCLQVSRCFCIPEALRTLSNRGLWRLLDTVIDLNHGPQQLNSISICFPSLMVGEGIGMN